MPFLTELKVEYVDGTNWLLVAPLVYEDPKQGLGVEVPEGFLTDFASVPRGFWNLFPRVGTWAPAATVHDFCYRHKLFDKATADRLFLHGMEELGVNWVSRRLMYRAVRLFGRGAY